MNETRQGRLLWSRASSGSEKYLFAMGGLGTQALIDELSTAEIDDEVKDNSIKFVERGRLLVRRFFAEGGLIGLEGKPFIQGLDNVDEFLYSPEGFRERLKRDIVMSYRATGLSIIDPQVDVQKLGIHPNRRIYFVNEYTGQALGYRVTYGGAIVFGVLNNLRLTKEGSVNHIQSGLATVVNNRYRNDRVRIAVAVTTVVNQSIYDLTQEARTTLNEEPTRKGKSESFLHRLLRFPSR